MSYRYDQRFFDYNSRLLGSSAEVVVSILTHAFEIGSVVDLGCGEGAWLAVWKRQGIGEILGVDGPYIDSASLLIDPKEFYAQDLSSRLDLRRRFDLAQSLEVAEHLPAAVARQFVGSLCDLADLVLFSAAVPGQGGENHLNEQPLDYWRMLFKERDYVALDMIRPQVVGRRDIAFWYRYNLLLYVASDRLRQLPEWLRAYRAPDDEPLQDVSPRSHRLRRAIVRPLPTWLVTKLAEMKKNISESWGQQRE